ncbi:MAG TPA: ABC transporter permease [Pseudonocardiaceae bacterium]|nr:ABC transporter permease [Pseudonocardiaceae bacterium]
MTTRQTEITAAGPDERLARTSGLTRALRRPAFGALLGAVVVFVLFAVTDQQGLWLTQTGFESWAQQASFYGIMAVPVGLLMIGGEFDLSTGGMTGFTAIITALLISKLGWNAWVAIAVTFVVAGLVGLLNGYVVVKSKLPSFIVTLATYFVVRGLSIGGVLLVNNGQSSISVATGTHSGLASAKAVFGSSFGKSTALPNGYSTEILWFVAVTVVATWILARTRYGNWVTASGGDQDAARNVGVPVQRTKISLFVMTSLATALVGVISFTQTSNAVAEQGVGNEFYFIIAAVAGGCLLTGGYGSVVGAALGACIIGMALEGVIYAGWDSSWDFTFLGAILFLAVGVNTIIYRRAMRARR